MTELTLKIYFQVFLKDKYEGAERTVLGKWYKRNGAAIISKERKSFDIFLKNGNIRLRILYGNEQ